jgi:LmbE family N-acetylglucosaminyl deacetylase
MTELRLMCVLAHPDDESMGAGGTLALCAAEGIATSVVCATRGERGWAGPEDQNPGLAALGRRREAELRAAAQVLGVREVAFLDYVDGDLDQADPGEAIARIVAHVRRVQPHVVVTFGPDGAYGHPDHIAICQLTIAALVCAADAAYRDPGAQPPHRVSKLYYLVDSKEMVAFTREVLGGISIPVDGEERQHFGWDRWALTAQLDCRAHWRTVWRAVQCHQSQLPTLGPLNVMADDVHERLWGHNTYLRAFSLVNGGRAVERDLFAGLR